MCDSRPTAHFPSTAAVALLGGVFGSSVAARLGSGGFIDQRVDSTVALRLLIREYPSGVPNLLLLVTSADGVDSPDARATGERVAAPLRAHDGVTGVQSREHRACCGGGCV
jgi:RND superfamily putative drug exporter